ncbi:DUF6891 domain-containing protein [Nocardiopsis sp. CNT312]|uniref:DUF6891 domain-containing protein n=1 Tax=Nocardiopsis sp. CNT312 TaxID=1137268 RepID=UPI000491C963|nr:hypothetical protein [Nocardiopsis sp. CNT312]
MSGVRQIDDSPLARARRHTAVMVASGRGGFVEIRRRTWEAVALADPAALDALVDRALHDHLHRQRLWPARTDSERLTRAFRALDESGILAREDCSCCDRCARDAVQAEAEAHSAVAEGPNVRGYAFFHERDAEAAMGGGPLWIGFGALHEIRHAAVGDEIAQTLRAHGLTVTWDGDPDRKLEVVLDWRRRRRDRGAARPGVPVDGEPEVEVAYTDPGPFGVPEWMDHYRGRVTVRELARMVLPWLPGGYAATLTSDRGHVITVERDAGLLCVSRPRRLLARERLEEPLSRWAVGGCWPAEDASSPRTGVLDVKYSDTCGTGIGFVEYPEPMETAAACDLVHRLTPAEGSFAVFDAPGGAVVQMVWEAGPRLWMESPSPEESLSRGRHVTASEAEEMVRILAEEGRVALADLGALAVTPWG